MNASDTDSNNGEPRPLLELEDVRAFIVRVKGAIGRIQRLGQPSSSWINKMPYHYPRANFLAKGLRWPNEKGFSSEQERRRFYKSSRKRQNYLMCTPPTWSFMVVNVALVWYLTFEPAAKWTLFQPK
eukprot:TRINITY_DN15018_c0_g1_i1.p1 TRINITY_DN15018_c0_g1~~TRINITY_DN15018_c0_g1_i1.p1  ORF type:complete len:127 (-),score=1.99 TRINITY_DN15018_c0_g1_i1:254-634(-)